MAISKGNQPVNSFVKGLITEVSPLSFPDQASLDEVNFKLKHDGTRERRLGLDYENGYTEHTLTSFTAANLATATQSAYRWINPNGSSTVEIGVIQVGRMLYFIDLLKEAPSSHVLNGGVGIDTGVSNESRFAFTTLNNYLIAVNPSLQQPYLVSYNDVTDVISYETAAILIRDLYGVDDDLRVDERPTVLSEKHRYNLRNQGWSPNIVSTCGTDALDCTFSTHGVYPSNADQWGIGRIADLANADVDKYDPNIAKRNILNNGQVPRGHYIIRAFFRGTDRTDRSGIALPLDKETSYITTVAGYAGRAWYSGIRGLIVDGDDNSPKMGNAILYSQIFRTKVDLIKCYQENDPTSYRFADLIDTDGGVIHIPECANIVKLMAIKHSLFVFAENGVWEIRGDEGGFRATSFQVNKVSNVGVYSPQSIIEVNGVIYFWAITGIYSIVPNAQLSNVWDTTNITLDSIQRVYNSIPDVIKKGAKGYYDLKSNTARWLYTSDSSKIVGNPIDVVDTIVVDQVGTLTTTTGNAAYRLDVVKLTETLALLTYTTSLNVLKCRLLTISGLAVSFGAEQNLTNTAFSTSVCRLTDTTAVVTYLTTGNVAHAAVLTVSGATVSIGTAYNCGACSASAAPKVEPISSTQSVVAYLLATALTGVQVLDVAGTVITPGVVKTVGTSASENYIDICVLTSTTAVVTYWIASAIIGVVCTITGSTVTNGSEYTLSTGTETLADPTDVKRISDTTALVTWRQSGSGVIKSTKITTTGSVLGANTPTTYTELGAVFDSIIISTNKQLLAMGDQTTIYPKYTRNTLGTSTITEGSVTSLGSETSFEYTGTLMNSTDSLLVYKSSLAYPRAIMIRTP